MLVLLGSKWEGRMWGLELMITGVRIRGICMDLLEFFVSKGGLTIGADLIVTLENVDGGGRN